MNEQPLRKDYHVYIRFLVSAINEDAAVDHVTEQLDVDTFMLFHYDRVEKVTECQNSL